MTSLKILIIIAFILYFFNRWKAHYHSGNYPLHYSCDWYAYQTLCKCKYNFYSEGCKNHFSNCLNVLDIILILLNITSIALYIVYHNLLQEIEDVTLAFLIILRNGSQLLRLIVLIKNQKTVKVNWIFYKI